MFELLNVWYCIADWQKIGFMRATIERFDPSSSDIKKIDDAKKKIDDMNN